MIRRRSLQRYRVVAHPIGWVRADSGFWAADGDVCERQPDRLPKIPHGTFQCRRGGHASGIITLARCGWQPVAPRLLSGDACCWR